MERPSRTVRRADRAFSVGSVSLGPDTTDRLMGLKVFTLGWLKGVPGRVVFGMD